MAGSHFSLRPSFGVVLVLKELVSSMVTSLMAVVLASAGDGRPVWGLAAEVGGSLMTPALHATVEGGYRVGPIRILARVEWNPWLSLHQARAGLSRGVVNVGLGAEFRSFQGRLRSAVYVGASVLLFRSALDEPGTLGPYFGISPTTVLFPLSDRLTLRVDPLSFHIVVPSLTSIPLIALQYRHSIGLEVTW